MTTPRKKPAPKPQKVPAVPELTAQDCHNLIQLLNRVQTNGIQEAQVLLFCVNKLDAIKKALDPNQEIGNGEDADSASE